VRGWGLSFRGQEGSAEHMGLPEGASRVRWDGPSKVRVDASGRGPI